MRIIWKSDRKHGHKSWKFDFENNKKNLWERKHLIFIHHILFFFRKFKGLGNSGFSLRKQDNYIPFQCMFMLKKMTGAELNKEGSYSSSWFEETSTSGNSGCQEAMVPVFPSSREVRQGSVLDCKKLYTILYCVPLVSPYSGKC